MTATGTVAAGPPLTMGNSAASVRSIATAITALYRSHPDLTSYVVQGTAYTKHSRAVVFKACTAAGSADMSQNAQSARLDACAPMIFYYYNYGVSRKDGQALTLANRLFTYAVTDVHGPLDSEATLANLIRSWGITVKLATPQTSPDAGKVAAILERVDQSIASQRGVRVTVLGRQASSTTPTEQTLVDVGTKDSTETITEPGAHAKIVVAGGGAFMYGDRAGLTKLLGLTQAQATKADGHWIEAPKGTKEYDDLAAENTISSLPAAILPGAADSVTVKRTVSSGQPVTLLTWHGTAANSSEVLTEQLELTNAAQPLPIKETTHVGADQETVAFSRWGEPVIAAAPPASDVVPYGSLIGR